MSEYRWKSPLEWLQWRFRQASHNEVYVALVLLASQADQNRGGQGLIETIFETEMTRDGYFESVPPGYGKARK